ncbi:MAG: hypothetical protein AB7S26_01555 [Sandaracinaceae bacterium]
MTRVLVLGEGPVGPDPLHTRGESPRRAFRIACALRAAGHEVQLFAVSRHADGARAERRGISVFELSEHTFHERPELVHRQIAAFDPGAIVGVDLDACALAVNVAGARPLHCDLGGDPMSRAQTDLYWGADVDRAMDAHRKLVPVLLRGDRFTVRTHAHRYVLIGQLGLAGRLVGPNDGFEFVYLAPAALDPEEHAALRDIERKARKPGEPFVLVLDRALHGLSDPMVLYDALEMVMVQHPEVRALCLGGGDDPASRAAWSRMARRAIESGLHDRFELVEGVGPEERLAYLARAHVSLLIDRFSYAGCIADRPALVAQLAAGLPVVVSQLTELGHELIMAGVARGTPCSDLTTLRFVIEQCMEDPDDLVARGIQARRFVRERVKPELCFAPIIELVSAPRRAPGGERRIDIEWPPGPVTTLHRQALELRARLTREGARQTLSAAGRFAMRRLTNGAARAIEELAGTDA